LLWLTRRAPHVRFVWLMGADNLRQFDRWRNRLPEADAARLATTKPPAFVFLHGPRSSLSSTALRRAAIENASKSRHVDQAPRIRRDVARGPER
jgi:nicotinate-nucleotide adenylyltransferase